MDLPKHQPTHCSIQQSALGCCHYVPLFLSSGHKSSPQGVRVQPLLLFWQAARQWHRLRRGGAPKCNALGAELPLTPTMNSCYYDDNCPSCNLATVVLHDTQRVACLFCHRPVLTTPQCWRSAWWLLCQHNIITLHCVVGFWWALCAYAFWILWQIREHCCPAQKQPRSRNIYKKTQPWTCKIFF